MEDQAPKKRGSVAELAGKFSSAPPEATQSEADKPVRRRPPRTLQLHTQGEQQEKPAAVTSPMKVKRNSALIEKLQANLVLPTSPHLPSPKSPGLKLLPPTFTVPSPCPVSAVTATTPLSVICAPAKSEEEVPASFEAPPTTTEGSLLPSINKGRARHSIKRRPPSRRHRKSSSGDEVGGATAEKDTPICSPSDAEAKTDAAAGEKDAEVFNQEEKTESESCRPEEETTSTCREEVKQQEEEEEEEEETPGPSSDRKEEEEEETPGPSSDRKVEEEAGSKPGGEPEETSGKDEEEETHTEDKQEHDDEENKLTDRHTSDG